MGEWGRFTERERWQRWRHGREVFGAGDGEALDPARDVEALSSGRVEETSGGGARGGLVRSGGCHRRGLWSSEVGSSRGAWVAAELKGKAAASGGLDDHGPSMWCN
ncbi:uncharacterized protein A4U43_UnF3800 [Asparagus officinalis]|uniref:Uncharacterized protein n=1 Tax=Asparagus officinalis TaxID=4686 RepID=A0A1R3L720_ASPOF|nr:uncharacterized protein A4U43_UnF3800 [Asparagus officinalis]